MVMPPLKHIVDTQLSLGNISVTLQVVQIAVGTVNPNSYTTQAQVRHGSLVKKLTIQLDIVDLSQGTVDFYDWYVWFNIGGVQARANPNNLNPSVTKNQVFHQDGCLDVKTNLSATGVYVPWIHKWRIEISIPPAFQRVNENDVIELVVQGGPNTNSTSLKARVIYKEIFP